MNNERLKKLAGVSTQINENQNIMSLADNIYTLAEEIAYNNSAPTNQAVTGDQIYDAIETIIEQVKDEAQNLIRTRHMS